MLLALKFLGIELRFHEDVGQNIDGQRNVVGEHARVERCRLDTRGGVDFAPHILDLGRNFPSAAAVRTLERHMFQQVRDAVFVVALIASARLHPNAECNGFNMRKGFGGDRQAVRQTAYLYTHVVLTP